MTIFYNICYGLSLGVIIGFLIGTIRLTRKRNYSEKQTYKAKKIVTILSFIIKYLTLLSLILGLIWCLYFLLLGIIIPNQAEYATNMSQLIVSVLTIISIIFAFFEFIRRK